MGASAKGAGDGDQGRHTQVHRENLCGTCADCFHDADLTNVLREERRKHCCDEDRREHERDEAEDKEQGDHGVHLTLVRVA